MTATVYPFNEDAPPQWVSPVGTVDWYSVGPKAWPKQQDRAFKGEVTLKKYCKWPQPPQQSSRWR